MAIWKTATHKIMQLRTNWIKYGTEPVTSMVEANLEHYNINMNI